MTPEIIQLFNQIRLLQQKLRMLLIEEAVERKLDWEFEEQQLRNQQPWRE